MRHTQPRVTAFITISLSLAIGCGGKAIIDGAAGGSSAGTDAGTTVTSTNATSSNVATGTGGPVGALRECATDADCGRSNSCCGCLGYPIVDGDPGPNCDIDCQVPACEVFPTLPNAQCVRGQCVLDVNCTGPVSCNSVPPACPNGTVATAVNDCWGPCIAATECPTINTCDACPNDAFCLGAPSSLHCIPNPENPACDPFACSCIASSVCENNEVCDEALSDPAVRCMAVEADWTD